MIFPDEKMIKAQVKPHTLLDAPPEFLSAYYDGFKLGAQWAIAHTKSAASEEWPGYERRIEHFEGCIYIAKEAYQAAVISTAAKYEEKLREKDAEIKRFKESREFLCGLVRLMEWANKRGREK